eukprot:2258235-Amphidinium_carterae.1
MSKIGFFKVDVGAVDGSGALNDRRSLLMPAACSLPLQAPRVVGCLTPVPPKRQKCGRRQHNASVASALSHA